MLAFHLTTHPKSPKYSALYCCSLHTDGMRILKPELDRAVGILHSELPSFAWKRLVWPVYALHPRFLELLFSGIHSRSVSCSSS